MREEADPGPAAHVVVCRPVDPQRRLDGFLLRLAQSGVALADSVLLWFAMVASVCSFARLSAWAAILLFPNLAWVSFAAILNGTLWKMN